MVVVGTCGFTRSKVELFSKLDAVEVQETFYKHVEPSRAREWRKEAQKEFIFTVKASQYITHEPDSPTYRRSDIRFSESTAKRMGSFKMTREVLSAWRKTEEVCKILGARVVLFQTPQAFKPDTENLENVDRFFLKAETDMLRAWEPRGEWSEEMIHDVCSRHNVMHCVDPFAREPVTSGTAYFRLHGKPPGSRNYYYSYSDAELRRLRDKCSVFDEVFVFFNNVSMLADATRFRGLLGIP